MNLLNKFRNFPELSDFTSVLSQQRSADESFQKELKNLVGFEKMSYAKNSSAELKDKIEGIRQQELNINQAQITHLNQTKDVYRDIQRLGPNHDVIADKRGYLDKVVALKNERIAKREKLEQKLNETANGTPQYNKIKNELDEAIKQEQSISQKLETENQRFDIDFKKYQQIIAGTVAANLANDAESRAHVASTIAECGIEIHKIADSIQFCPEEDDKGIDDEIKHLHDLLEEEKTALTTF